MNSYFEVGARYDKTMEDGVVRKVQRTTFWMPSLSLESVSETKYMDYFPYNNN